METAVDQHEARLTRCCSECYNGSINRLVAVFEDVLCVSTNTYQYNVVGFGFSHALELKHCFNFQLFPRGICFTKYIRIYYVKCIPHKCDAGNEGLSHIAAHIKALYFTLRKTHQSASTTAEATAIRNILLNSCGLVMQMFI